MALTIAAAGPDCESDRKSGVRLLTDVVEKGARDFRRLQGSPSANPGYSQRRYGTVVRTENLNPHIMVIKSAKDSSSDRYEKLLEHGPMSAMLPWSHRGAVRTSK